MLVFSVTFHTVDHSHPLKYRCSLTSMTSLSLSAFSVDITVQCSNGRYLFEFKWMFLKLKIQLLSAASHTWGAQGHMCLVATVLESTDTTFPALAEGSIGHHSSSCSFSVSFSSSSSGLSFEYCFSPLFLSYSQGFGDCVLEWLPNLSLSLFPWIRTLTAAAHWPSSLRHRLQSQHVPKCTSPNSGFSGMEWVLEVGAVSERWETVFWKPALQ